MLRCVIGCVDGWRWWGRDHHRHGTDAHDARRGERDRSLDMTTVDPSAVGGIAIGDREMAVDAHVDRHVRA